MVSSVFQVFLSVSDVCFICFQTYVAIVAYGCFKLDRVLHLPPCLSIVLPRCQPREGEGSLHWRGRTPRVCGRAKQARRGQADAGRETGAMA
jgi:hypothetical protein